MLGKKTQKGQKEGERKMGGQKGNWESSTHSYKNSMYSGPVGKGLAQNLNSFF